MATSLPVAGEAAHEAASSFPPFDSIYFPSQLLWLAVSFATLYYLMSRIALPRVQSILAARQQTISADLDRASAFKAEADVAASAYESSLAKARSNAQDMVRAAHESAAAETERKRKALETELNDRLAGVEAQIAEAKRSALANVAGIAREVASAIIVQLTGTPADPKALERAVKTTARQ
jgi:F-type H+-transporting ATPase subunit b